MPNRRLLNESGLGGHIKHIHEDFDLTFGDLKKIFILSSEGKLKSYEKIDGFNIFLSFADGKAVCARNKSEIKNGGLDLEDLSKKKFKGGPEVQKTYIQALEVFEKTMSTLSGDLIKDIFQNNGQIFYNCEIVGPHSQNIVQYDSNIISVHRTGHLKINAALDIEEVGQEDSEALEAVIDKVERLSKNQEFRIQNTKVIPLTNIEDKTFIRDAYDGINEIMEKFGIHDDSITVSEFVKKSLISELGKTFDQSWAKKIAADCILGSKKIADIPAKADREFVKKVKELKSQKRDLINQAVWPLEEIVHEFSIKLLENIEDSFSNDTSQGVEELKADLTKAIKAIKDYNGDGSDRVKKDLAKNLSKIKNIERITAIIEGLVFEYEGSLYKMTGNFAPINQILGIYRYGRGDVPPLANDLEETASPMMMPIGLGSNPDKPALKQSVIAIMPGSFKPPHAGHYGVVRELLDKQLPDGRYLFREIHVLISPKPRFAQGGDGQLQVTAEQSKKIWDIYTKGQPKIVPRIAQKPTPVQSTYQLLHEIEPGAIVVVIKSQKDAGDDRFAELQNYADEVGRGHKIKEYIADMKGNSINGSAMRELIASGDSEGFRGHLPTHISTEDQDAVWAIVNNQDVAVNETAMRRSFGFTAFNRRGSRKQIDEVSQEAADYIGRFIDHARHQDDPNMWSGLSFNSIFGSDKTRLVVDYPDGFVGKMQMIASMFENVGWDLVVGENIVEKEYDYRIPAGPKEGEVIKKKEKMTVDKYFAKMERLINELYRYCIKWSELEPVLREEHDTFKFLTERLKETSDARQLFNEVAKQINLLEVKNPDISMIKQLVESHGIKDVKSVVGEEELDEDSIYALMGIWANGQAMAYVVFTNGLTVLNHTLLHRIEENNFNEIVAKYFKIVTPNLSDFLYETYNLRIKDYKKFLPTREDGSGPHNKIHRIFAGPKAREEKIEETKKHKEEINSLKDYWDRHGHKARSPETVSAPGEGDSAYKMIITRNPIDVLTMSEIVKQDGNCHREGGSYFHCAVGEAHGHGLCAYIVKTTDLKTMANAWTNNEEGARHIQEFFQKDEIFVDDDRNTGELKPLARGRLRKAVVKNTDTSLEYEIALPETRSYGPVDNIKFHQVMCDWAWDNQINRILEAERVANVEEMFKKWEDTSMITVSQHGGQYSDTSILTLLDQLFRAKGYPIPDSAFRRLREGVKYAPHDTDDFGSVRDFEIESFLGEISEEFEKWVEIPSDDVLDGYVKYLEITPRFSGVEYHDNNVYGYFNVDIQIEIKLTDLIHELWKNEIPQGSEISVEGLRDISTEEEWELVSFILEQLNIFHKSADRMKNTSSLRGNAVYFDGDHLDLDLSLDASISCSTIGPVYRAEGNKKELIKEIVESLFIDLNKSSLSRGLDSLEEYGVKISLLKGIINWLREKEIIRANGYVDCEDVFNKFASKFGDSQHTYITAYGVIEVPIELDVEPLHITSGQGGATGQVDFSPFVSQFGTGPMKKGSSSLKAFLDANGDLDSFRYDKAMWQYFAFDAAKAVRSSVSESYRNHIDKKNNILKKVWNDFNIVFKNGGYYCALIISKDTLANSDDFKQYANLAFDEYKDNFSFAKEALEKCISLANQDMKGELAEIYGVYSKVFTEDVLKAAKSLYKKIVERAANSFNNTKFYNDGAAKVAPEETEFLQKHFTNVYFHGNMNVPRTVFRDFVEGRHIRWATWTAAIEWMENDLILFKKLGIIDKSIEETDAKSSYSDHLDDTELNELSAGGGGAVGGFSGNAFKADNYMINREEFITEVLLRKKIRELLEGKIEEKALYQNLSEQDKKMRQAIQSLIAEAKKSPIPHDNTGINVLEDTLKKIVPIIRDAYFTLTSNANQRRSFRAHIVNGFRNSLQPARSVQGFGATSGGEDDTMLARPMAEDAELDGIDVGLGDEPSPNAGIDGIDMTSGRDDNGDGIPDAQSKFIETEPEQEKSPEEEEMEKFTVDGEDSTGRNMALDTFKKIEKTITDAYSILDTQVDKNAFYEWGITNIKLHFDRFEDELANNTPETDEGAPQ